MSGARLEGVRVLLTRPRGRNEELAFLLEDEGAEVSALPVLELLPPTDPRPLAAAAEHVSRYRWVIFASSSAVEAFGEALREAGTRGAFARARIASVGPKTSRALRHLGVDVTIEAQDSRGPGLFLALKEDLHPGDELLLPAAEEGRTELRDALVEAGFSVTLVAAYRTDSTALATEVKESLRQSPPRVVVIASPRTAEVFFDELADAAEAVSGARVVAIGPTTAGALEAMGRRAAEVAERPTAEALVEAVVRAAER